MSTTPPVGPADRLTLLLRSLREVTLLWREVTRVSFPSGSSGLGVLHLLAQQTAMRVSDLAACRHVGLSTVTGRVPERT
jgi:hypothetical protein